MATNSLRIARERLASFLREALTLRSTLQELRRELDLELPSASIKRQLDSPLGKEPK